MKELIFSLWACLLLSDIPTLYSHHRTQEICLFILESFLSAGFRHTLIALDLFLVRSYLFVGLGNNPDQLFV